MIPRLSPNRKKHIRRHRHLLRFDEQEDRDTSGCKAPSLQMGTYYLDDMSTLGRHPSHAR